MNEPRVTADLPMVAAATTDQLQLQLAHGEAAFVLLESILIGLIERSAIDTEQLMILIEDAVATKRSEVNLGRPIGVDLRAAGALSRLANSVMSARQRVSGS